MMLNLDAVKEDPTLQLRDGLDMDRVLAMVEFEEQGGHLPPITVIGDDNLLGDGHHRLAAARRAGRVEIEAERVPGGRGEAVAIAIQRNDIATSVPLTRPQRNAGVKLLLQEGWTQDRIATVTNVHQTTIMDIHNSLAMRGQIAKRVGGKGTPKPVAVLPEAVHEKLNDTTLTRIATLPIEQQAEMAEAVAGAGISEPRVREAIQKVKHEGMTPTEAVAEVTPERLHRPIGPTEVARAMRQRLEHFISDPVTIGGEPRDFWQVLDFMAAHRAEMPLEVKGIGKLLADLSAKSDHYASLFANGATAEVTR